MGDALDKILRAEIQADGPIPYSRWMQQCLYHPEHGYYTKTRPPGRRITGTTRQADFATPPTLHPFFGEAVADHLAALWNEAGQPDPFTLVEYGGGEGDLARNALARLDAAHADLAACIRWHHIDVNPDHRQRQRGQATRHGAETSGQGKVGGSAAERPGTFHADVVLGCEFLDALPFDVWRFDLTWQRLEVSTDGNGLVERWMPGHPPASAWPPQRRPERGQQALAHTAAAAWLERTLTQDVRFAVFIDYGQTGPITLGTEAIRSYHQHHATHWLDSPGEHDLTGSVDFAQVALASRHHAMSVESLEVFLLRQGVLEALAATQRNSVEGASSYLRLRQLLLPNAMGATFKVATLRRK